LNHKHVKEYLEHHDMPFAEKPDDEKFDEIGRCYVPYLRKTTDD